jgi:hypothetical protein
MAEQTLVEATQDLMAAVEEISGYWTESLANRMQAAQAAVEREQRAKAPRGWDKIEGDDQPADNTITVAGITTDRTIAQLARDAFWGSNEPASKFLRDQFPNGCTLAEAIRFFHNVMQNDSLPWKLVDATRPPAFSESECGGAFDGVTVTSDADPGL